MGESLAPSGPNTNWEPAKEYSSSFFTLPPAVANTVRPASTRSTRMAKSTGTPRPQSTVYTRMARRLVENTQASVNSTAIPSNPVSRSIPPSSCGSVPQHSPHQPRSRRGSFGDDAVAFLEQRVRLFQMPLRVVVQGAERLARGDRVADFLVQLQPHGGIDGILFLLPASAQQHAGGAHLLAADAPHESRRARGHRPRPGRARQGRGVVDGAHVTALQADDLAEFLQRLAAGHQLPGQLLA